MVLCTLDEAWGTTSQRTSQSTSQSAPQLDVDKWEGFKLLENFEI